MVGIILVFSFAAFCTAYILRCKSSKVVGAPIETAIPVRSQLSGFFDC